VYYIETGDPDSTPLYTRDSAEVIRTAQWVQDHLGLNLPHGQRIWGVHVDGPRIQDLAPGESTTLKIDTIPHGAPVKDGELVRPPAVTRFTVTGWDGVSQLRRWQATIDAPVKLVPAYRFIETLIREQVVPRLAAAGLDPAGINLYRLADAMMEKVQSGLYDLLVPPRAELPDLTGYRSPEWMLDVPDGNLRSMLGDDFPLPVRRLRPPEVAIRRHRLGLTLEELADAIGVNPRTVRAWESGRDPVPVRIRAELDVLAGEHDQTLADMIEHAEDHQVVGIFRDKGAPVPHPRGWYVAAAARAMDSHPDMVVAWLAHQ